MLIITHDQLVRLQNNVDHPSSSIDISQALENFVRSGMTIESFIAGQDFQIAVADAVKTLFQTRVREGETDYTKLFCMTAALLGGALSVITDDTPIPAQAVEQVFSAVVQGFSMQFAKCAMTIDHSTETRH